MRIGRTIAFNERVKLERLVDMFNFINRFNVADVNTLLYTGRCAYARRLIPGNSSSDYA